MAQWSLLCFGEIEKKWKGVEKRKVVPLLVFACDKIIDLNLLLLALGWEMGGNV